LDDPGPLPVSYGGKHWRTHAAPAALDDEPEGAALGWLAGERFASACLVHDERSDRTACSKHAEIVSENGFSLRWTARRAFAKRAAPAYIIPAGIPGA